MKIDAGASSGNRGLGRLGLRSSATARASGSGASERGVKSRGNSADYSSVSNVEGAFRGPVRAGIECGGRVGGARYLKGISCAWMVGSIWPKENGVV